MSAILTAIFRHNHWANLTLLDACAGLTEEQLAADAPHSFGTIYATLRHVAFTEANYLSIFEPGTANDVGPDRTEAPDLDTIRRQLDRTGLRLIELVDTMEGDPLYEGEWQGRPYQMPASIPLLQVINHGTEHRSQIASALGDLGVEPPGLDSWSFAAASRGG